MKNAPQFLQVRGDVSSCPVQRPRLSLLLSKEENQKIFTFKKNFVEVAD